MFYCYECDAVIDRSVWKSRCVSCVVKKLEANLNENEELRKRLAAAEARLDAGEALLNRMSMNLILSGYSPEGDKNNPLNDWLGRVVEWKKARLERPVKEASGR